MSEGETIEIIKANGEREAFQEEKLHASLSRAGADEEVSQSIVDHITRELRDGMTTREIYDHAHALLKEKMRPAALRYSLRRAVMELGPTGFPFERFVAHLLTAQGYHTEVGRMLKGECVTHEVDVLAEKENVHIFVEAKFHNEQGIKTDLKDVLYIKERFRDLEAHHENRAYEADRQPRIHDGWLVTNTKLTTSAREYGECRNMIMIAWNYPEKGNLQDRILESDVHPLTALTTLSERQKAELLKQDIVRCTALREKRDLLHGLGLSDADIDAVMDEVDEICALRPVSSSTSH